MGFLKHRITLLYPPTPILRQGIRFQNPSQAFSAIQGAKTRRGLATVKHFERKKTENLERIREDTARGESYLSQRTEVYYGVFRYVGEDPNIKVLNLTKDAVEARKLSSTARKRGECPDT
jgi:hypothetical protein